MLRSGRSSLLWDSRGQGLAEYIIIVVVVATLVIIGLRYYGGSLFGEFQNATEQVNAAGSNKTGMPLVVGAEESSVPGVGEQAKTSEKPAEEAEQSSSAAKQSSSKGEVTDLQSRLASLRPGVGDTDDQIVSELSIDWKTIGTILGILVVIGVAIVFKEKRTLRAPQKKSKKKKKLFGKSEDGQVLVIGLIVCVGLFMASITVANVGMMVAEKIKLQDTVDAAAYSSAVAEARYMNLSAYLNRTMIANYDMMAFDTALWAVTDADDHGLAVITNAIYKIAELCAESIILIELAPDIDEVGDAVALGHSALHAINSKFNDFFAQDESTKLNSYIELYNTDILSMYQGLLYAAIQSSRYQIQREVAKKMDPEVLVTSTLSVGAEAVSFDELARAVDWVIKDTGARTQVFNLFNKSFDKMTGKPENEDDNPLLLAATTEASLNRFSAGRTRESDPDLLRSFNVGHFIPFGPVEGILNFLCDVEDFFNVTDDYTCDADINLVLGANMRDGFENKHDEQHVPFIARQRMREVNFFGLSFSISNVDGLAASALRGLFGTFLGEIGHTSGELHNDIGNVANMVLPKLDGSRFLESFKYNNFRFCSIEEPYPTCGLNALNILSAATLEPVPFPPPLVADDHWDGTFSGIEPVDSHEVVPPFLGWPTVLEYEGKVIADGTEAGVPKYDWKVDLDNVGFPNYIYPTDGAEARPAGTKGGDNNNLLTGPSIAVLGVKPQSKINNLQGLGIGNPYSMTAMARSQVYYVRNPKRPDEVPSLFNPHWVARLAPIESDDTPVLLKDGLPFIASLGLTVSPTH